MFQSSVVGSLILGFAQVIKMSLMVNKTRRDQLIWRFSRIIAKSTCYLESVESDNLCQVAKTQQMRVEGCEDVRVDFEVNRLDLCFDPAGEN